MKNKILNYIVFGIITLNFLISCLNNDTTKLKEGKETESKTEVNKTTENQSEFVYSSTDKVEIIIENDAEFLIVGKPTKIYLKKENIYKRLIKTSVKGENTVDLNNLIIDTSGLTLLITATKDNLLDGNVEIQLTERVENGEDYIHKLLVPVKKPTE
jgi:hypothetical protein